VANRTLLLEANRALLLLVANRTLLLLMDNRALLLPMVSNGQTAKTGIGLRTFLLVVNKTLLLLILILISHYQVQRMVLQRTVLQDRALVLRQQHKMMIQTMMSTDHD
jgi:hypothetical protein